MKLKYQLRHSKGFKKKIDALIERLCVAACRAFREEESDFSKAERRLQIAEFEVELLREVERCGFEARNIVWQSWQDKLMRENKRLQAGRKK